MSDTERHGLRYRFAGFELEPCERRLLAEGRPVTLTPKVFDTLVMLVERAGHLVSKDELMAALWPRGFVADSNLVKHIWAIRKVLGGSCEGDSRFIETVPKLGYRFVMPVERIDGANGASSGEVVASAVADPAASAQKLVPVDGRSGAGHAVAAANSSPDHPLRTADDLVAAPVVAAAPATIRAHGSRRGWFAAAGVLALAIIVAGAGVYWWRAKPAPALPPGAPGTALAIVAFNNLSQNPKDAWLGPALTEMLATEVTATGRMYVLPGELVRPARKDLPEPMTGGFAHASLAILRKRLGADYVISGSYLVSGAGADAKVRVDVMLQDAHGAKDIAEFSQSQPVSGLLALVANAGGALRAKLGLPAIGSGQSKQIAGAQPPSPDVARHIGFALDALDDYDPARARDELLQAVAQAPAYAPAYALLSRAWSALGYHGKAQAAIEQAAAHVTGLPERQRLQILAQQHALAHDWDAAAKSYAALIALQPNDPEPRFGLIQTLLHGAEAATAQKALQDLRVAVPDAKSDPRVENAAATIDTSLGNYPSATEHARKALELARQRDAAGLIAQAELQLGSALESDLNLGGGQAATMERRAVADFDRLGNLSGMAEAYLYLGNAEDRTLTTSREAYQQALALYQKIGDMGGQALAYVGLSRVLGESGDEDGAETALKSAMAVQRAQGDARNETWTLMGLARIESDYSAADKTVDVYRELLSRAAREGDAAVTIYTLANYANLLRERGQLGAAQDNCDRADKLAKYKGEFVLTVATLCAPLARDRGDVAAAIATLTSHSALNAKEALHPMVASATTIPLAEIEIQQGQWRKARDLLAPWAGNEATAAERNEDATIVRARAAALKALCDAKLGDLAGSRAAAEQARQMRARILQPRAMFDIDLSFAKLAGASGDGGQAVAKLRALAADADNRHWMASALEARLAAYRLLEQSEDPAADALHDRVASTAKAHGFKWVLARLDEPVPATSAVAQN